MKKTTLFFLLAPLFSVPYIVFAQKLSMPAPTWGSMTDFIVRLIDIVQLFALGVAAVWVIFCGFLLVTAGGDETALSDAKKRLIVASLILLVVIALKVAWTFLSGTYVALGYMAAIFLILFIFWALK